MNLFQILSISAVVWWLFICFENSFLYIYLVCLYIFFVIRRLYLYQSYVAPINLIYSLDKNLQSMYLEKTVSPVHRFTTGEIRSQGIALLECVWKCIPYVLHNSALQVQFIPRLYTAVPCRCDLFSKLYTVLCMYNLFPGCTQCHAEVI